jgi:hypothetical protein
MKPTFIPVNIFFLAQFYKDIVNILTQNDIYESIINTKFIDIFVG